MMKDQPHQMPLITLVISFAVVEDKALLRLATPIKVHLVVLSIQEGTKWELPKI
jgi:hypothetical protein